MPSTSLMRFSRTSGVAPIRSSTLSAMEVPCNLLSFESSPQGMREAGYPPCAGHRTRPARHPSHTLGTVADVAETLDSGDQASPPPRWTDFQQVVALAPWRIGAARALAELSTWHGLVPTDRAVGRVRRFRPRCPTTSRCRPRHRAGPVLRARAGGSGRASTRVGADAVRGPSWPGAAGRIVRPASGRWLAANKQGAVAVVRHVRIRGARGGRGAWS